MPLPIIANVAIIITAFIGFVLGWMDFSFTYLAAKDLKICWRTQVEMAASCALNAPYSGFKTYEPPMANAHFAYFQLICMMILVGYILKAAFYWCNVRSERRHAAEAVQRANGNIV